MSNLLLKINMKLGGQNVHPSPAGCALMRSTPTIVLGADVYHPPPGADRPIAMHDVAAKTFMIAFVERLVRDGARAKLGRGGVRERSGQGARVPDEAQPRRRAARVLCQRPAEILGRLGGSGQQLDRA